MQLLLHTGWEPQDTHAHTLGREILCLHSMQLLMYTSWWPQKTFARPFRREAFCSHNLLAAHSVTTPTQWHNTSKPQEAQCTSIRSGERHFRCEQCNYSSHRAGHLKNHKPTHTGEKFFFSGSSATTLAVTQIVWSVTCFHTLARNLLPESTAPRHLQTFKSFEQAYVKTWCQNKRINSK